MNIYGNLLWLSSSAVSLGGVAQVPTEALTEAIEGTPVSVVVSESSTVVDPTQVVYGPQFFIALLSGVILAFGFQLLLTNLSMAAGVSYAAHAGSGSSDNSENATGIKTMGIAFRVWTLVTVSLALFFACWLSIRLTAYGNPFLGAD